MPRRCLSLYPLSLLAMIELYSVNLFERFYPMMLEVLEHNSQVLQPSFIGKEVSSIHAANPQSIPKLETRIQQFV